MNTPINIFQPPNPPVLPGDLSKYHTHTKALQDFGRWSKDFTRQINDWVGKAQVQLNTQVQGVGDDIAAATTISVSSVIQRVTGTAAIQTITPPPAFSGPIFLVARDGFSFTTGGNIANSISVPANSLVTLVYTPQFSLWWVTSVTVADGSITTAKLADGAVTTGKLAPGAATVMTSTVDNTSQNIVPYDTVVTVASETVTIDAVTDQVHVTGRLNATASNIQSTDSGMAFLYRDAVLLDTAPIELTLSTTTTVGGSASAAFSYFDTGISGAHTYSCQMSIHNGSGNATFGIVKDSCALIIVDMRAQ